MTFAMRIHDKYHTEFGEIELRRRLSDLLLGDDLAYQVYGPIEKDSHAD